MVEFIQLNRLNRGMTSAEDFIESFAFIKAQNKNNEKNKDQVFSNHSEYAIDDNSLSMLRTYDHETQENEEKYEINDETEEQEECICSHEILKNAWFAVFDTETTGNTRNDVVVQMCVLIYDKNETILQSYDKLWKIPTGVTMNPRALAVHNISEDRIQDEGVDASIEMAYIMRLFKSLMRFNILVVAHNTAFDNRLLKQTALVHGIEWKFDTCDFFCTQSRSRTHVKALDKRGRVKAPSNKELYYCFHSELPDEPLHDAFVDCKVTAAGFIGGARSGWW